MNVSQRNSSLSCYCKTYLDSRRGKIKVQPTAVSRSKFKKGSKQKRHATGKRKIEMLNRRFTRKTEHNFVKIVKFNKTSAKKSGRTVSSTTTYLTRMEKVLRTVTTKTDKETEE